MAAGAAKLPDPSPVEGHSLRARLRRLRKLAGAVWISAFRHNATGAATQFAYNAFLATIPFLFVLISLVGVLGGRGAYDRHAAEYEALIPEEISDIFRRSIRVAAGNATQFTFAVAVAIPFALYVVSNATGALIGAVERAHEVDGRPWVRGKLVAVGFAVIGIVLVLATTVALVGGTSLIGRLVALFSDGAADAFGPLITYPVSIGAIFLFTLLLYRFGPSNRMMPTRHLLPGALFAMVAWTAATSLFSLYARHFDTYAVTYGRSFGFVVIYLVFFYISGLSVVVGAEINHALSIRRNRDGLLS